MEIKKWIIQSFWTKPMSIDYIKYNINIAKVSLYYAHRSGYYVKMYTDSLGYKFLKKLGYDAIVKDLDDIPQGVSGTYFAYSKYVALKNEPLGVVHTDFDVFIKKPCLDDFYYDKTYDVVLQQREPESNSKSSSYEEGRRFFRTHEIPDNFNFEHTNASNVGVIGFNNEILKNMYLDQYKTFVDFYKNKYDKFNFIPDLFFEQINIDYLCQKYEYKIFYLLPELWYDSKDLHRKAKEIGYQHLIGWWKYSMEGQSYMEKFIKKLCKYEYYDLVKIWACPCSGKSNLCLNNNHYIDFDTIKKENGLDKITTDYDEYITNLFKLFNDTCEKYNKSGKILLLSDTQLLHAFYHIFDKIYYLDKDVMLKRMVERSGHEEHNFELWCESIDDEINFIKNIRYVEKLDGYLSDLDKNNTLF